MRTILYIAGKDLLLRWRDRLGFFWWMVGFPLLIAILIGTIFSGMLEGPVQRTKMGLVDLDRTPAAREYVQVLEQVSNVETLPMSETEARRAIRRGSILAYVRIDPGFHVSPAIFFGHPLPLVAAYDPARKAEWTYLEAGLNQAAAEYLRERWVDPQRRPALIRAWLADLGQNAAVIPIASATIEGALATMDRYLGITSAGTRPGTTQPSTRFAPVQVMPVEMPSLRPRSSFEICFPIGIIWGLLGLSAEFAIAFVHERQAGTLLRLRAAPFSRFAILTGTGLACFVSCVGVALMLLMVGHLGFGVRLHHPGGLAAAVVSIALCFVGLTMLLSVLGKTESAVGGGSWAVLLILAMLGGGMVPQMFMPNWMTVASNISPVKWAISALEGGIWREFGLRDMLRPCAVLVGQGVALGALGITILYRSER